jgi:hypothetical protein
MEAGVPGVPCLLAVSTAEGELKTAPDFATTQHLLMEEQLALDQILK